jgi:hypothetical protein
MLRRMLMELPGRSKVKRRQVRVLQLAGEPLRVRLAQADRLRPSFPAP